MKYIMKNCGCVLSKEDLTEHHSQGYRCPNHPSNGIDYMFKNCVDCGARMRLSTNQSTKIRCDACRIIKCRERNKYSYKTRFEKNSMRCTGHIDLSLYTQGLDRYLKTHEAI